MDERKCSTPWKQKKKMKSLKRGNREFSNKNSMNKNKCVDNTNRPVQQIYNDCTSKTSNSYNISSGGILKPKECCSPYQCDRLNSVFVDVGSDFAGIDYLLEEDDNICEMNSETLFDNHKDIDYNLVKSVKIERDVEVSSKENDINDHVDAAVFNISDICSNNDRPHVSTNVNVKNVCENSDECDKKPIVCLDYSTTSKVFNVSGGFEKIDTNVKEEGVEGESVHHSTQEINPKIKMVNDEEVSLVNESIIDVELQSVSKTEEVLDIGENNLPIVDGSCSDKMPDNSSEEIEMKNVFVVDKPVKAIGAVQREMETNLQFQNEVQTRGKFSRDYRETRGECLGQADENTEDKSKNVEMCQHEKNRMSDDTSQRYYICEVYNKSFTPMSNLKVHKRIHTGDRPFCCTICGKTFIDMGNLRAHRRIHTGDIGDRPFGCSICRKSFTQVSSLNTHKRIHSGDKPFVCSVCGKAFVRCSKLKEHKRIHSGDKPFVCSICGKAFTYMANLKTHKIIHTGDRPFVCSICGKSYTQVAHLNDHKRTHTGDKPFVCSVCGKTFARQSDLRRHKRVHTGEKPYICNFCDARFADVTNLRRHKQIHTEDRPLTCHICGKSFAQLVTLEKHKHKHTGNQLFSCTICGKAFEQLAILKAHKRIHKGDRPFRCSVCEKGFTRLTHLEGHKRVHTGDRPFRCSVCDKTFTRLTHLKGHQRIHTGEKPYGCNVCEARFGYASNLRRHEFTHTAERPFGCMCGKTFKQLASLRRHNCISTGDKKIGTLREGIEPVFHLLESTSQAMLTQCTQMNTAHCGTACICTTEFANCCQHSDKITGIQIKQENL